MNKKKCLSLFNKFGFDSQNFNDLAKATRFKSRFRSLMAFDFLFTLLASSIHHHVSYNRMARNLCCLGDTAVSKQALQKAMAGKPFLLFLRLIFKSLLAEKLKKTFPQACGNIDYLREYWFRIAPLLSCLNGFLAYFPVCQTGSQKWPMQGFSLPLIC
jgi:hypothetical protein